jgi:gluconate 5-dehydrogenase
MSKSFALDYAKYNVRSNSIVLGYFPTKMTMSTFKNKKSKNKKINRTMLGRLGELEEIFETIEFLSTDKSSYITGQEITIDGGWTSKGL